MKDAARVDAIESKIVVVGSIAGETYRYLRPGTGINRSWRQ
jgi:hypothetical protein